MYVNMGFAFESKHKPAEEEHQPGGRFPFFPQVSSFSKAGRGKIKQTFRKEQKERGRALRCLLQTVGDTSLSIWLRAQCS